MLNHITKMSTATDIKTPLVQVTLPSTDVKSGSIRVGKIVGKNMPTYPGYKQIIVKTKSDGSFWQLSPYYLQCPITDSPNGLGIMENIYQSCKLYTKVYKQNQRARWNNNLIIWEHPEEQHIDQKGNVLPAYLKWRRKSALAPLAVRYPNGFNGRHECQCALFPDKFTPQGTVASYRIVGGSKDKSYIASRKDIYCPLYGNAAKIHPKFKELQDMLKQGHNLLILDVDGPTYTNNAPFNQVKDCSIDINETNIKQLLNAPSQPFGHGYVLAVYLLGKEEWLK